MPTSEEAKPLTGVTDDYPAQSHIDNPHKSHIGKAVLVKGNIAATEDLLVDGRVEGAIAAKNSRLEIGVTAQIDANAFAKTIVINGEIKGDVHASDQVIVAQSGRVYGNIYSPDICMEDGALLKGSINMEKQDISWEDSIPDAHDDDHERSSSFGFLFRRTRNVHAEHAPMAANPESTSNKHEEIRPIVLEKNNHQECCPAGKSIIGRAVLIKGQIESEEDVIIRGEIDGTVYFKDHSLEIGSQAHIKGNIFVKNLIAFGEIKGDICASEHVAIKKPGHVIGVVRSPRVSIESGAVLMGKVEMEAQNVEEAYSHSNTAISGKDKGNFLSKHSLEANFEDVKSGLQSVVIPTKPKRVPWPE